MSVKCIRQIFGRDIAERLAVCDSSLDRRFLQSYGGCYPCLALENNDSCEWPRRPNRKTVIPETDQYAVERYLTTMNKFANDKYRGESPVDIIR